MKNILLKVTYDGTNFFGFQSQPDKRTVEGVLSQGIRDTVKEDTKIYYAGRTDRGVHALGQYANFKSDTTIDIGNLPKVINFHLPKDVSVIEAKFVEDDFHARFSAKKKKYRYIVHRSRYRNALLYNRVYEYPFDLDVDEMRKSMVYLLGEHDYNSFMGRNAIVKDTKRSIDSIEIIEKDDFLYFDFVGKSFLKNMIRIIVGTALEIGEGKYSELHMKEVLDMRNRKAAGPTAPSCGLYLLDVKY